RFPIVRNHAQPQPHFVAPKPIAAGSCSPPACPPWSTARPPLVVEPHHRPAVRLQVGHWLLLAESHLTRSLFGAMVCRIAAFTGGDRPEAVCKRNPRKGGERRRRCALNLILKMGLVGF